MSGSAIADALVTMLGAASAFGSTAVGKDYSVLERSSGSCCVVTWRRFTSVESTYGGGSHDRQWTHSIQGFIKDLGDPISLLGRVLTFSDTILNVIEHDGTLQGTVNSVNQVNAARDLNAAVQAGGAFWIPIFVDVVSTEFSDS